MQFELINNINSTKPSQENQILIDKKFQNELETSTNSAKNNSKATMRKIKNDTQNQSNIQYIIAQKHEPKINNASTGFHKVTDPQEAKQFVNEFFKKNNLPFRVKVNPPHENAIVDLDSSGNIIIKLLVMSEYWNNDKLSLPDLSLYEQDIPNINKYHPWLYQIKLSPLGINHSEYKITYLYGDDPLQRVSHSGECLVQGNLSELPLTGPFYPQSSAKKIQSQLIQKEETQTQKLENDHFRVKNLLEAKKFAIKFLNNNEIPFSYPLRTAIDSSGNIIIRFNIERNFNITLPSFKYCKPHSCEIKLSPLGRDQSEYKIWYLYESHSDLIYDDYYQCKVKGKLNELPLRGPFYPNE